MQPHEVCEVEVTFQPLGRTVRVMQGSRLMEAAFEAGAVLDLPCGGEGVCGKCRIRVCQGAAEPGGVAHPPPPPSPLPPPEKRQEQQSPEPANQRQNEFTNNPFAQLEVR